MSLGVPRLQRIMQNIMQYTIIHIIITIIHNYYYNSYPPQPKSVGNHFLDISKAFLRLRPWASLGVPRLQRIMQNIMQYTIIHTPPPAKKCWKSFFSHHFLAISKAFPRLRPWVSLGVPMSLRLYAKCVPRRDAGT